MITFFLDLKTASVPQRASFGRCLTSPSGKTPDIFRHRNLAPKLENKFTVFLKSPFAWGDGGKTFGNCAGRPAPASISMDFLKTIRLFSFTSRVGSAEHCDPQAGKAQLGTESNRQIWFDHLIQFDPEPNALRPHRKSLVTFSAGRLRRLRPTLARQSRKELSLRKAPFACYRSILGPWLTEAA